MKKDIMKIFIDEMYSKAPKRNYETNEFFYNQIDEKWSIDLADKIDSKFQAAKAIRLFSS